MWLATTKATYKLGLAQRFGRSFNATQYTRVMRNDSSLKQADPRTGGDEPYFAFEVNDVDDRSPHMAGMNRHVRPSVVRPMSDPIYSQRHHHNGALIVKYGEEESVQK